MGSDLSNPLDYLFYPRSIAVIGASSTPGKWGFNILNRLVASSLQASIYPVHRSADEVQGRRAYRSLSEISGPIDLAIIAVPSEEVPKAMQECASKSVKVAIIITAGFKETGQVGAQLESEVLKIAKSGGVRIVGPNCMGHFNTAIDLFTTDEWGVSPGCLALISQSGNLGGYILQHAADRGIGFSKYVSSGNEADLTIEDYLEYLSRDEQTQVICAYVESIKDGRRFFDIAQRTCRRKPIVVLKIGRSAEGARAALSHTGALSGSDAVHDAAFRQSGVIRVEEADHLIDVGLALIRQPLPRGRRVGIVTVGGGFGAVAADACRRYGLEVPPLSQDTIQTLNKYLPPRWSHSNPVDMAGVVEGSYGCIGNLLKADYIDAVLAIGTVGFPVESDGESPAQIYARRMADAEVQLVDGLIQRIYQYKKPVIVTTPVGRGKSPAIAKLEEHEIYAYQNPEAGVRVISHLAKYADYLGVAGS